MRSTSARWWAVCLAIVLAAGLAAAMRTKRGADPNEAKAKELYYDGLTAMQAGQHGRAATLFAEAWAANPSQLSPLVAITATAPAWYLALDGRIDSIPLANGDSLLWRCARAVLRQGLPEAIVRAVEQSANVATRRCGTILRAFFLEPSAVLSIWPELGDVPAVIGTYAPVILRNDSAEFWTYSRRLATAGAHPMLRLEGYVLGGAALHRLGQHERAVQWEREAEQRAREWGPGAMLRYLSYLHNHEGLLEAFEVSDSVAAHVRASMQRAVIEIANVEPLLDFSGRYRVRWWRSEEQLATGSLNDALAGFAWLARVADSAHKRDLAALAYARQGRTLVKLGRLKEAERALLRARELGVVTGETVALREASHDLLHLYEGLGRHEEAVAAGHDFARYAEELGTRPTRMMAYHDLGSLLRRKGKTMDADRAFMTMIAEIDTLRNNYYWAGEYYEHIGRLERAREYYLREESGSRERARMRSGLVRVSEALGEMEEARRFAYIADRDTAAWFPEYVPLVPGILARSGRIEEARTRYMSERAAARARGKTHALAQLALESAELERAIGNAALARLLADSAAAAAKLLGATELEVRAQALSAAAALESGVAPRTSTASLDAAVRRGERMRIPQLSAELNRLRGDAFRRLGDTRSALASYDRAAAWVDSVAEHIESDPARAGHRASHVRVSNRALSAIVHDLAYPNRVAQYSEWSARRKRRSGAGTLAGSPTNAIAISGGRPELGPNAAIVDYVVLDTLVAALVVTSREAQLYRLPVVSDSLRTRITRFLMPIAPAVGSAIDVGRIGFDSVTARQLYRDLIEPLRGQLTGVEELAVVPDGSLHMLPFDALLHTATGPRFLIDDFTIRYLGGLAVPRRTPSAVFRSGPTVAVRGPQDATVAGTAEEIAAVAASLKWQVVVLDSAEATKAAIRARVGDAAILHFATHAEANDVNPDFARIALAPGVDDDGWLEAFEIRTWKLNGALVVLSACQTAAGRLAAGEGTLSVSRAFLQAGAGATIATLWPVGAPTVELMRVFYQQLSTGADVDHALRMARLALRDGGYSHPFYWAPFILTTRQP